MQREHEKDDNGKKNVGDRDGPAMDIGDVASQETDPQSSDNNSPSSEISSEGPPATAVVQDAENSAPEIPQQLHSGPSSELASGDDKGSNVSNLKKNLNLDLESKIPTTPRLPIISLGDETCPMMPTARPFASVVPMTIPSVEVDSSRCLLSSVSTSEESLRCLEGKKDSLDVNFSPGKRKAVSPPVGDKYDSGNSESNPGMSEKPRQKKSMLNRLLDREKSPLRKKEKSWLDLKTKTDKSSTDSRSKRDKSPTNVKKRSPKGSPSKPDKSPTRSQGKRARSPSKIFGMVKNIFCKQDDESKLLCETEDGSKAATTKKGKRKDISKFRDLPVPKDFNLISDVNFSDTTCDSTSTKFSRASISTDSPMSDTGNATRANLPARTPINPEQETETSDSESDDGKMG